MDLSSKFKVASGGQFILCHVPSKNWYWTENDVWSDKNRVRTILTLGGVLEKSLNSIFSWKVLTFLYKSWKLPSTLNVVAWKVFFYCFLVVLLPNFILSCNSYQIFFRFYTHDQALEAIYQAQKMVLGDNLLKVSTGSGSLSIRPS